MLKGSFLFELHTFFFFFVKPGSSRPLSARGFVSTIQCIAQCSAQCATMHSTIQCTVQNGAQYSTRAEFNSEPFKERFIFPTARSSFNSEPRCACVRVNSFKVACAELHAQSLAYFYSHVFVRFGVASLAWLQAMFGHYPWPSIFVLKL